MIMQAFWSGFWTRIYRYRCELLIQKGQTVNIIENLSKFYLIDLKLFIATSKTAIWATLSRRPYCLNSMLSLSSNRNLHNYVRIVQSKATKQNFATETAFTYRKFTAKGSHLSAFQNIAHPSTASPVRLYESR